MTLRAGLALAITMLCVGCATQPNSDVGDVPGFFSGLIHGLLIFPSMIGSIFFDIRVYAFPNSGFYYDLGYVIGVIIFLGKAYDAK